MRRALFLVLGLALILPVTAQATILTGSFGISVFQGSGADPDGNPIDAPNNQANAANPLLLGTALYSGTYTGDIDFDSAVSGNNILAYILSAGGSLSGTTTALNTTLSTPWSTTGGITTVMEITWYDGARLGGSIYHDDGVSLYLNGATVLDASFPTSPRWDNFGLTATGGNYRMIYAAANGLPEKLAVDITQVVPEPGTIALLGLGLLGFGLIRRRNQVS